MSSAGETMKARNRQQIKQWTSASGSICQPKTMDKDELLFRCYSLLQELEKGYVGDLPGNDQILGEKYDWQLEFHDLNQVFVEMGAVIREKISQAEKLKNTSENVLTMLDNLSENFQFVVRETAAERETLIEKQTLLEEIQRIVHTNLQSSGNIISDDVQINDNQGSGGTGDTDSLASFTQVRLGFITNSYETLARELVRKEQLLADRELQILELEHHIRAGTESESKRSSSSRTSLRRLSTSSRTSVNSTDATVAGNMEFQIDKTQELIQLVKRLQAKLAKKKEREKIMKEEKETLYHMAKIVAKINGSSRKTDSNFGFQVSSLELSSEMLPRKEAAIDIGNGSNTRTLKSSSLHMENPRQMHSSLGNSASNTDGPLGKMSRALTSIMVGMAGDMTQEGARVSPTYDHEMEHVVHFMTPQRDNDSEVKQFEATQVIDVEEERKLAKLKGIVHRLEADFIEARQELRMLKSVQAESVNKFGPCVDREGTT